MAEGVVLLYGFLVSFVLSSTQSNKKAKRPHPAILTCVAWAMMSLSFGVAGMLALRAIKLWAV